MARLLFSPSFKLLESVEGFALFAEQPASTIARSIISE
jgi:hypothetical protein